MRPGSFFSPGDILMWLIGRERGRGIRGSLLLTIGCRVQAKHIHLDDHRITDKFFCWILTGSLITPIIGRMRSFPTQINFVLPFRF